MEEQKNISWTHYSLNTLYRSSYKGSIVTNHRQRSWTARSDLLHQLLGISTAFHEAPYMFREQEKHVNENV